MEKPRVVLKGSERQPVPNAGAAEPGNNLPNPNQLLEVTISVRRKNEVPEWVTHTGLLTREQLASDHGATASDFMAITKFAEEHGLRVTEESPVALTIKLAGGLGNMEKAFGTTLKNVKLGDEVYRERTGPITIPAELEGIVKGVFGLDNRPQARPKFQLAPLTATPFSPVDVARLYSFPTGTGAGQIISIIELGGGFVPADINTYFSGLGLTAPTVTAVPVSGGTNLPTGAVDGPDGEVMLDIEVAGAVAPQAKIKVYFAPNTDKGFLDAVNAAIHETEAPTAVSISWGSAEGEWTASARTSFDTAFQNAAALSIPVTVASGDNGSTDKTNALTVDFPASAPHALGCGGTHLEGGATITEEVVWNAGGGSSGGGVSAFFTKPSYQNNIAVPAPPSASGGRGVPDVCGNASVETGYKVRVDGTDTVFGGTSAVAPLWAGLIARLAQNLGHKIPFLNPVLYANPHALRDIVQGNNDVGNGGGNYKAGPGWDACTGLGSPNGAAILSALKGTPTPPQSPTPKPTPTHTHAPTPTHTHKPGPSPTHPKPPGTGTGTTGGTGDKASTARQKMGMDTPQPAPSNPITPPGDATAVMASLTGGAGGANLEAQSIVALVALQSNVTTAAITAITAIASMKKS